MRLHDLLILAICAPVPCDAQAAEEFFAGKQIQLLVSSEPGTVYDSYARLVARHIGKYLPGAPQVVVQNVPGGGSLALDGRAYTHPKYPDGYFVGPTIFTDVTPDMTIAREEIFGPVLCVMKAETFEDAVAIVKAHDLGNATSIFTSSGKYAREYRWHVEPSMLGVNIGVAAPMAFFPFGGAKGSFFGDLKAHGRDSIEFFTDKKVTITRWF